MKRWLKILIATVSIIIFIIAGLVALLLTFLTGLGAPYEIGIAISIIFLSVWIVYLIFNFMKKKKLFYILFGYLAVIIIVISVDSCIKSRIAAIPVLRESNFSLYHYKPFLEDSRIVLLQEEPTLKFTDSLPAISGATALYPLYAAFVRATYPEDHDLYPYDQIVKGGTTPKAYEDLINGEVDIIFCAAPSQSQIEEAIQKGITFNMTPIGKEAFVFFVNKENPVSELTVEQIQKIYSGEIRNWKELGGKNETISAYQRPKNSGSQTMLEYIMGDIPIMDPLLDDNVVIGMGEIIDRTSTYKNFNYAIGYSFLYFTISMVNNNDIKLLKLNGVMPQRETIISEEYPFTGDFYAITTNTDNKNVQLFIDWILSPQGQNLVEETGYVPVK